MATLGLGDTETANDKDELPERPSHLIDSVMRGALLERSISSAFQRGSLTADGDTLGFGFFRHDALQLDMQQTIGQIGTLDLDMVSQAERQFERTLSNPLMQVADALVATCLLYTSPSPRD